MRTVIFFGQVCGSSHRVLQMSAALVPFLVPQTMRWDLGKGFAVGVVVERGRLTWSVGVGVGEGKEWCSLSD